VVNLLAHTEESIQYILGKTYGIERGYITMPNVLLMNGGMYEADFIYINKHKYLFEVEIKISISDFKADFNKRLYHNHPKVRALYYAIPEELFNKHNETILELTRSTGAGVILCKERCCEVWEKPSLKKVEPLTTYEMLEFMRIGCLKWIKRWDKR
jgi:hypothetical protein